MLFKVFMMGHTPRIPNLGVEHEVEALDAQSAVEKAQAKVNVMSYMRPFPEPDKDARLFGFAVPKGEVSKFHIFNEMTKEMERVCDE